MENKKDTTNKNSKKMQPTHPLNAGNKKLKPNIWWGYLLVFLVIMAFYFYSSEPQAAVETNNIEFKEMVLRQDVKSIEHVKKDNRISIFLKEEALEKNAKYEKFKEKNVKGPQYFLKISEYTVFSDNLGKIKEEAVAEQMKIDSMLSKPMVSDAYDFPIKENTSQDWGMQFIWFLPILIILFFFIFSMRSMRGGGGPGGGIFNIGKSKAQLFDEKSNQNLSFKDVAGLEGAKYEVEEIVDFLKNPKKYTDLGGKIPKGALLIGPPGTGKTLLAKAVAGEAKVPFFSLSGSDFVEMFVGVGASRVRDLFKTAKEKSPCIVFIDEIDAVGRHRGAGLGGGHDEREQTLNQLLVEMDGFGPNEGVIIIAATNRMDILDPALLRPGRFDRRVVVMRPDIKGREAILHVHAKNKPLGPDVDLREIAKITPGFTGADLANLLNEAALLAARRNAKQIDYSDVSEAVFKTMIGPEKKSRVINEKEKKLTAYHEAGHAIVLRSVSDTDKVERVSIIPAGGAGGYTAHKPHEDMYYLTQKQLSHEIMVSLGGRAAEEIILGEVSTGASSDLQTVSRIARDMITKYGMSKNLENMVFGSEDEVFLGKDYGHVQNYSEHVASIIDKEVQEIIDTSYKSVIKLLREKIQTLHRVAERLLEKEKIEGPEFEEIFSDCENLLLNPELQPV